MAFGIVKCSVCGKEYLKDRRHIKENIKLKNNFYCSRSCFSKAKNKQRVLICENPSCNNKFKRPLGKISFRNFCSNQCAMKMIGPENGLKHKKFQYCQYCGTTVKYKKTYCSPRCWGKAHELTKEVLIKRLRYLSFQLNRPPTRRECKHVTACIKQFGSWDKALVAAGLEPNRSLNQRMFKRRICVSKDGHKCDSVSELIIDNWLTKHGIPHRKEQSYPTTKHTTDWALDNNTYMEYFGLANDSKKYDKEIRRKRQLCEELGIELIEIYSKDLFPKNSLERILNEFYSNQSLISFSASSEVPEA